MAAGVCSRCGLGEESFAIQGESGFIGVVGMSHDGRNDSDMPPCASGSENGIYET